ncbi:MAG: hypothetical protein AAGB12_04515 [Pseudomonadota bacterium]
MTTLELTEDQRDCLQELSNIAMGQAGDSLARFLEVFVHLSVPKIQIVQTSQVSSSLKNISEPGLPVIVVGQSFYNAQGQKSLHGEAIVIYSESGADTLSNFLGDDESKPETDESLMDISNILISVCLNGLAEQLDTRLSFSAPTMIGKGISCNDVFNSGKLSWDNALLIEINYTFESTEMSCNLVLIMPDESVEGIIAKVNEILDEF